MATVDARHSAAFLLAASLVLSLAGALAACSGAPEGRPSPAATATIAAPQPTATPSPTPVATAAPTGTPSPTSDATAAPTATPSPTATADAAPTATPSPTATADAAPAETPSATAFRYDTYDTTGEVAEPGSYAFLADPADTTSAVTTYEALRDGSTTALLIHKSDAHGASQAALYDAVEAGDLFEWHEADDCFVRYKVTEVKPDPAGAVPRKLLAVEWMTYAFTGCSGAVAASTVATVDWGELPDLGGASLGAPVVHGPWQLVPEGWTGAVKRMRGRELGLPGHSYDDNPVATGDLAEARGLPYWRDPVLPSGWTFVGATSGGLTDPVYGYCAYYHNDRGYSALEICGAYVTSEHGANEASWYDGLGVYETRHLSGRPALVSYSPPGPSHFEHFPVKVVVYDAGTGSVSSVFGDDPSLRGRNVDAVIAITRSLFEDTNPQ